MATPDIRKQFPIFSVHPGLIYLDNAATTQRPSVVLEAMDQFYREGNANIHRGVYDLSSRATEQYERARDHVARFIGAESSANIGFTKGTTESINIVAHGFLADELDAGDNVVVTIAEHHANFIPWQQVCGVRNAELRVAPMDDSGRLDMRAFEGMLDSRTKMIAVTHISNTLGSVFPIGEIARLAQKKGIPLLVDAAQSAALYPLEVTVNGIDFLAFSGHKIFGPFGTGILYVSARMRKKIKPLLVGGGMIRSVAVEHTDFQPFPYSLEAGTPNVAGIVGLVEAIKFLESIDRPLHRNKLEQLTHKVRNALREIEGLQLVGPDEASSSIISFNLEGIHPHDASTFLDAEGIAVRAGMHCTQPLMNAMQLPGTVRASFSIYNTEEEGEKLVEAVRRLKNFWG